MTNLQSHDKQLNLIKQSVEVLIIIELCKAGATRDEIRGIVGSLDNNLLTKIKKVTNKSEETKNE